jgi:hypothetical protein
MLVVFLGSLVVVYSTQSGQEGVGKEIWLFSVWIQIVIFDVTHLNNM